MLYIILTTFVLQYYNSSMCDKHHSRPDVSGISQKMVFHQSIEKDGMNQFINTKQKNNCIFSPII